MNFVGTNDEWVTYLMDEAKGIVIRTMVLPVVGLVVGLICLVYSCCYYWQGFQIRLTMTKAGTMPNRLQAKNWTTAREILTKKIMKKQQSLKRMEKMSNQRSSKRLYKKRDSSRKKIDYSSEEIQSKESRCATSSRNRRSTWRDGKFSVAHAYS